MATRVNSRGTVAIATEIVDSVRKRLGNQEAGAQAAALQLTDREARRLDLLCAYLGAGKNACIGFATKYLCCVWLNTKSPPRWPKLMRATKNNPAVGIEFKLNPEVKSKLEEFKQALGIEGVDEAEIAARSVVYLARKLIPSNRSERRGNA